MSLSRTELCLAQDQDFCMRIAALRIEIALQYTTEIVYHSFHNVTAKEWIFAGTKVDQQTEYSSVDSWSK